MKMVSSGFIQDYFDGASAFNVQGSWKMLPADEHESDRIIVQAAIADLMEPNGHAIEHVFAIKLDPKPVIYIAANQSLIPAQSAYADWLQAFVLGECGRLEASNN